MAQGSKVESLTVDYYRYYPHLILGRGNFATVYVARHKVVKCDVALKIINTDDIKEDYVRRNLQREEKIMRMLHHPNIIQLYEVVKEKSLYCLSLELIRGVNLYQYMANQPNHYIPEKLARFFFYQMLSAVEYMHNLNVIHRDLKLENILVEQGHIIKIADFGLSNVYYPCVELRTHCGSVEYAAPELFCSSAYGTAVDVWSLGVVLYVMVVGKMPFVFCQKKEDYALNTRARQLFMQRISKGLMQDNWEQMENLSPECWHFLHGLLEPDQFRRIRVEEAITHPWIVNDKYLIKRLPQRRRDLQRKFHPEVVEYIAYKLNTTTARIEMHLHVYQIDKVAAMYFMVLNVLVKEILHPHKAFENSFLYRFECWRENLKSQHLLEKNALRHKYLNAKEKKENFRDEKSIAFSRGVSVDGNDLDESSQDFNGKQRDSIKSQTLSGTSAGEPTTEYSVKKVCVKNSENKDKIIPRNPYRSYRNSRPVNLCRNNYQENVKSNKTDTNMEEVSSKTPWSQHKSNVSIEEPQSCQSFDKNSPKKDSKSEWKAINRSYQEYSPSVKVIERSKTKHTTYTNKKTSIDENTEELRKPCPAKMYTKSSFSANEVPSINEPNTLPRKIEILKRTKTNMDIREEMSKETHKISIGMQTPKRQPIFIKKIIETPRNNYAQTPSRIPVKIIRYGPPAPFSQSPMSSTRKVIEISKTSGSKFCSGDTIEDVK